MAIFRVTLEIDVDLSEYDTPDLWVWPELLDLPDPRAVKVESVEHIA